MQGADSIERQSDYPALLGESLQNSLTYPPHGVTDELEPAGLVEALGRLDEADIALVNQVGKRETLVLILFGYRDYEAQIGFGQFFQGSLVALLDFSRQPHLFLGVNERSFSDLAKIQIQRSIFVTILQRLLGHFSFSAPLCITLPDKTAGPAEPTAFI